jgi:hypothetical protein
MKDTNLFIKYIMNNTKYQGYTVHDLKVIRANIINAMNTLFGESLDRAKLELACIQWNIMQLCK